MKITSIDMIADGDTVFMKRRGCDIIDEGYVLNVGLWGNFSVFWEYDPHYLYSYKIGSSKTEGMELVKKGPNFEKDKLQAIIRLS